jgi:hypothetical protein
MFNTSMWGGNVSVEECRKRVEVQNLYPYPMDPLYGGDDILTMVVGDRGAGLTEKQITAKFYASGWSGLEKQIEDFLEAARKAGEGMRESLANPKHGTGNILVRIKGEGR